MGKMADLFTRQEEGLAEGERRKDAGRTRRELDPAAASWVGRAREIAAHLGHNGKIVTSDDVLDVLPLPAGMHPNTIGCIFKGRPWKRVGFTKTRRAAGRARMISQWKLAP